MSEFFELEENHIYESDMEPEELFSGEALDDDLELNENLENLPI